MKKETHYKGRGIRDSLTSGALLNRTFHLLTLATFGLQSFPIYVAVLSDFSTCSRYALQLDLAGKQFIKKIYFKAR